MVAVLRAAALPSRWILPTSFFCFFTASHRITALAVNGGGGHLIAAVTTLVDHSALKMLLGPTLTLHNLASNIK